MKNSVLWFILGITGPVIFMAVACAGCPRNPSGGIIPGPHGQSVLIKGESCTINDVPENTDDMMRQAVEHCIANRH